jgi:hypothetical protein
MVVFYDIFAWLPCDEAWNSTSDERKNLACDVKAAAFVLSTPARSTENIGPVIAMKPDCSSTTGRGAHASRVVSPG